MTRIASPNRPGQRPLLRARQVLATEAAALSALADRLDERFDRLVQECLSCPGLIVPAGAGKSGLIAAKWSATLASVGVRNVFLDAGRALHGDSGILADGDILIALSVSGETREVCALLEIARSHRGVTRVVVTGNCQSTAARLSDFAVPLGALTEADEHSLLPTTSSTALLALGDALAVCLSEARGLTPAVFFRSHPAGGLGLRRLSVREVMRQGSTVPSACAEEPVREVLRRRHRDGRRTGAVPILDRSGRLCGLFTDSDLVRLLETGRDVLLDGPVQDVMTGEPVTVADTTGLLDAVALLSVHRVSELPVVDRNHRLMGLLDITDVIGHLPPGGDSTDSGPRNSIEPSSDAPGEEPATERGVSGGPHV